MKTKYSNIALNDYVELKRNTKLYTIIKIIVCSLICKIAHAYFGIYYEILFFNSCTMLSVEY